MSVSSHVRTAMRLGVAVWLCAASPLWAAEPEDPATLQEAFLHWQQGYVLHISGNYHEAIASFRRSIEAYPTAEGHTFLGWSLSHLEPRHFGALAGLGLIYLEMGQERAALEALERALEVNHHLSGTRHKVEELKEKLHGKDTLRLTPASPTVG